MTNLSSPQGSNQYRKAFAHGARAVASAVGRGIPLPVIWRWIAEDIREWREHGPPDQRPPRIPEPEPARQSAGAVSKRSAA